MTRTERAAIRRRFKDEAKDKKNRKMELYGKIAVSFSVGWCAILGVVKNRSGDNLDEDDFYLQKHEMAQIAMKSRDGDDNQCDSGGAGRASGRVIRSSERTESVQLVSASASRSHYLFIDVRERQGEREIQRVVQLKRIAIACTLILRLDSKTMHPSGVVYPTIDVQHRVLRL